MTFYKASDGDPDTVSTTDLSSMPYLGFSAQFALSPGPTHVGIDSSLLFGEYSDDTEEEENLSVTPGSEQKESNSDSAFGFGGYAKLRVEYALSRDNYIEVAVRGVMTNLEFDQALEDGDLSGLQGFVTFTHVYSY